MSVEEQLSLWGNGHGETFFFGNKNKSFVRYLRSILSQKIPSEMMEASGWFIEEKMTDSKYARAYAKGEYRDSKRYEYGFITPDGKKWHFYEGMDTQNLLLLLQGKPLLLRKNNSISHPILPIIRLPGIPVFRWCFAEFALFPSADKCTEVIFFDT